MSVVKKCFLVFAVVLSAAKAWGQAAPSPFTTYGIGDPYGNQLIQNQGAGGIGVSQPQFWNLNNQNPALLVYNTFTVFQVGIIGESRTIKGDTSSEKSTGGNLNYLVMAFPVKINKWTTSAGLMPYTNVNYNFQYLADIHDQNGGVVGKYQAYETGTGGLTQLYWSNGVRINKQMALGLKATYLFGPISNVSSNLDPNQGSYVVNLEEKTNVNGFNFSLGYSFSQDSLGPKHDHRFSAGAVVDLPANLGAKIQTSIYRTTLANDTIERYPITDASGKVRTPPSYTIGVSYGRDLHWYVGTEFAFQNWSSFRSVNPDDEGLKNSWRASLGGEFTPDPMALESYLKRITFRAGVSYEQYPYVAVNSQVKDIGINFGFSLPAGRSSIDLGGKIGKRGNKADNVLEENYFKIYFGITFNDQWFIKRKFD
ncbi:hypothetical protein [Chryseolinea lacunae]|uniref:Aromatic hydrocarbon degradation protein n=1 Tax=Chryseolinea lacunae TaxID=2801331 RepID=A0ABS1KS84_9BACT|nr:hypothetical protein [Chryseolinea lacunae]MBL0742286.1 hypothetical protein [Chryseolinea lacunae]